MHQLAALQQVLDRLRGDREVREALHKLLKPLRHYDKAHSSDLLLTLTTFLQEGGNIVATAERLFLHRNSVLYRLRRIEELIDLDVRAREARETLQMAYHMACHVRSTVEHQQEEES